MLSMAHGNEPKPPALDTATASSLPCEPAMGAWMTGSSIPNNFRSGMEFKPPIYCGRVLPSQIL
jgi:hypothetical protein